MKSLVFCLIVLTPLLAWAEESEIGIYHQTLVEKGGKVTPRFFSPRIFLSGREIWCMGFCVFGEGVFFFCRGFLLQAPYLQ